MVETVSDNSPAYVTPPTPTTHRLNVASYRGMKSPTNSVYEFNDEMTDDRDDPGLMIDESPRRHKKGSSQGLKIRLNLAGGAIIYGEAIDMSEGVEVLPSAVRGDQLPANAHNGIDELLRASAYAPDFADCPQGGRLDELE